MSAGASTWAQPITSQEQRQGKSRNADFSKWLNVERSPLQASHNPPSRGHGFSFTLLQDRRSPGEGSVCAAHGKRRWKSHAPAPHPRARQGGQCPAGQGHQAACSRSDTLHSPALHILGCPGIASFSACSRFPRLHSASATGPLPTWEVWGEKSALLTGYAGWRLSFNHTSPLKL